MKIPTLRYRKIFLVLSLSCLALAVCGGGRAATVLRPGVYRWTVPASDAGGMIEVEIAGGGGGGASAIVAGSHALLIADDGGGGGGGNNHGEDARGGFGQMLSTFLPIAATVADSRTCSGPCVYAGETLTLTVGAGGTGAKGIHGGIGGMGFGGRGEMEATDAPLRAKAADPTEEGAEAAPRMGRIVWDTAGMAATLSSRDPRPCSSRDLSKPAENPPANQGLRWRKWRTGARDGQSRRSEWTSSARIRRFRWRIGRQRQTRGDNLPRQTGCDYLPPATKATLLRPEVCEVLCCAVSGSRISCTAACCRCLLGNPSTEVVPCTGLNTILSVRHRGASALRD